MLASEEGGQSLEADEEAGSPNEEAGAPEPEAEETLEANQEQLEEENIHEGNLTIWIEDDFLSVRHWNA